MSELLMTNGCIARIKRRATRAAILVFLWKSPIKAHDVCFSIDVLDPQVNGVKGTGVDGATRNSRAFLADELRQIDVSVVAPRSFQPFRQNLNPAFGLIKILSTVMLSLANRQWHRGDL